MASTRTPFASRSLFLASWSTCGKDRRQGGHQVAQKSSTTTLFFRSESFTLPPSSVSSAKSGAGLPSSDSGFSSPAVGSVVAVPFGPDLHPEPEVSIRATTSRASPGINDPLQQQFVTAASDDGCNWIIGIRAKLFRRPRADCRPAVVQLLW